MKVVSKILLAISIVLLISSCSSNSKEELQYFSFKVSQSDKWGIIDGKGNVVVEDEFSNQPLIVKEGMFFVPNDEGLLYLYSIDQPTKEIDVNFKQAYAFSDGVAPTVRKGENIKFIDKKGNVVFELSPEYIQATPSGFCWTILKKETDSTTIDVCVNNKGVFFEPKKYQLDRVVADNVFLAKKGEKVYLINSKEEELFDFSETSGNTSLISFTEDLKYYTYKDGEFYGLKTINGDVVVRAKYKVLNFSDKYVIFSSDFNYYGIMNLEGEILIKEKYKRIFSIKNNMFVAGKDSYDECGLLTMDEDKLLKFEYSSLSPISGTDYFVAEKKGDKSIYIINKDGEPISKKAEFCKLEVVSVNAFDNFVIESDYFDVQGVLKSLLEPNDDRNVLNMYGFKDKTPKDVAQDQNVDYFDYDDILYSQTKKMYGLPYQNLKNTDWNIEFMSAYNEYLDYYCSDDDGEDEGCVLSSTQKCQEVQIIGTLAHKNRKHFTDLIDGVESYLTNNGFKLVGNNTFSNSDWTITYKYSSKDFQIGFWITPQGK